MGGYAGGLPVYPADDTTSWLLGSKVGKILGVCGAVDCREYR